MCKDAPFVIAAWLEGQQLMHVLHIPPSHQPDKGLYRITLQAGRMGLSHCGYVLWRGLTPRGRKINAQQGSLTFYNPAWSAWPFSGLWGKKSKLKEKQSASVHQQTNKPHKPHQPAPQMLPFWWAFLAN